MFLVLLVCQLFGEVLARGTGMCSKRARTIRRQLPRWADVGLLRQSGGIHDLGSEARHGWVA